MTDNRTMEELLQAPTEGYGEAVVISEILAENFEIKTNLLQLVQANKFHGSFFQNQASTLGTLSSNTIPNPKVERETEETTDKEQTNFQGSTAHIQPSVIPIPIPEPDVPKTLPKPNIPYPSRLNDQKLREKANVSLLLRYSSTYDDMSVNRIDVIDVACEEYAQEVLGFSNNSTGGNPTPTSEPIIFDFSLSLTPFEGSDFILEEIEAYLKDDSVSSEIDHADLDPEGDICLIEKLLNNDPFQLPPMDLKQVEVTKAKSSIEEPPELELKDLPSHLEYSYLEGTDKLPHAQPEDIQEFLHKLLKDLQIIREELAEYINSPSWNHPAFYNDDDDDDEEYTIQYREYL
ncbi:hypothetical protein Tco_1516319 [Tanacetum coccineum]